MTNNFLSHILATPYRNNGFRVFVWGDMRLGRCSAYVYAARPSGLRVEDHFFPFQYFCTLRRGGDPPLW